MRLNDIFEYEAKPINEEADAKLDKISSEFTDMSVIGPMTKLQKYYNHNYNVSVSSIRTVLENNKNSIIKFMLSHIKIFDKNSVRMVLVDLRNFDIEWPELDIIQKGLETMNKKAGQ